MKNMHSCLKTSQSATSLFFSNTFSFPLMRMCAFKCLNEVSKKFQLRLLLAAYNFLYLKITWIWCRIYCFLIWCLKSYLVKAPKGARILSHCGKLRTNLFAVVGRGIFPVPQHFWNLRIKNVRNCNTAGGWSCQIWMQNVKERALNQSAVLFEMLCGCPGRPFLGLGEMFSLLCFVGVRAKAMPGRRNLLGI